MLPVTPKPLFLLVSTAVSVLAYGLAALCAAPAQAQRWGEPAELQEFVGRQGKPTLTNLRLIESSRLMEGGLAESPWSGDFWPDQKGSIADPYNETGTGIFGVKRIMWKSNRARLLERAELQRQAVRAIHSIDERKFDDMSPSEKYDLLMGDPDFTLTRKVVEMVEKMDEIGLVAPFSGVCHGWGPASLTIPRPERVVSLMSPFGRRINFYPFDIKALSSFLWGKSPASNNVKFDGNKCYSGGKKTHFGRLVDPKCFNVNPAQFHLVAVNQLGLNRRGFLVDRKNNGTVWNHPIYAYRARFFSVASRHPRPGLTLDQAKVRARSIAFDPFREFRSPGTVSLVGVEMTFWYGTENRSPDHVRTDDPSKDKTDHQTLKYDLELDADDNVIGGEWREFNDASEQTLVETIGYTHPNSIWLVPEGVKAYSPGDIYIQDAPWDGRGTAPASWREAAVKHASSATIGADDPRTGRLVSIPNPQPLGPVVELLTRLSRRK